MRANVVRLAVACVAVGAITLNAARVVGQPSRVDAHNLAPARTAISAPVRRRDMARAAARRKWLASPTVRAQRLASRMAFHHLSAISARDLLTRDYGPYLAGKSANPAAQVAAAGQIVRYEGDATALVRTKSGALVREVSTVPLRVAQGGADKRPVSLVLRANGADLSPINPLRAVSISDQLSGGASLLAAGVRFIPQGINTRAELVLPSTAFFPEVGTDEDAMIAPTLHGLELSTVLRSRLSPESIVYRVVLPREATLRSWQGGALITAEGGEVRILPPSVRDAQGQSVPVWMSVSGDRMVLHVPHRTQDVAYPLFVDPSVIDVSESSGWSFSNDNESCEAQIAGGAVGQITAPTESFPHENCAKPGGTIYKTGGEWRWSSATSPLPASKILAAEAYGVSFSATVEGVTHAVLWGFTDECGKGAGGIGGYNNEPPASIVLLPEQTECNETGERAVIDSLEYGTYEGTKHATVSASLKVEAFLISSIWPGRLPSEEYGLTNPAEPYHARCIIKDPVNCATGNEVESQSDLSVGGLGPGLHLTRTYNSLFAAEQYKSKLTPGVFGYGWTAPYSSNLTLGEFCELKVCVPTATILMDNGSTVRFMLSKEQYKPVAPLVQATLVKEGTEYVFSLPDQTRLRFNSAGKLLSETDRNGNTLSMAYNTKGQLESVADPAGRKLTFAYNSEGFVESVKDPMGHAVKYTYEAKSLKSVTQPAESALRWQFKYNTEHEMTSLTDGRSNVVKTEYSTSHKVSSQTDPMERKRTWKYSGTVEAPIVTITEPNGAETYEEFDADNLPVTVIHALGKPIETVASYKYDIYYNVLKATDPDGHATEYGYNAAGDRTSERNADSDETKWSYDGTHDVETMTTPEGETTKIKRDTHGNPERIERPAPGETTQTTIYEHNAQGELTRVVNPLEHAWTYEYDKNGDRTVEKDPEGNKRTWEYNEDSQETATVSPRGHVKAGEEASFTTKTERDAQGRPTTVTDPLGHSTKYTYDGNGNLEMLTDGNGNKTKNTYDADNEQTKSEEPNKTITETGFDSCGQVTSQTDGNKHTTKYVRNLLERVAEVLDPRSRTTSEEYDRAGNLLKSTDAEKRVTTYKYDSANLLKEISYSDGKTHAVEYEYNKDGVRTKMVDGSGTTTYQYDRLERLSESEDGHKDVVKFEYNLANKRTKITYPNGKAVTREYDKDGRLEKVTDWSAHLTKFTYDPDSDVEKTVFPAETADEDRYTYNDADQLSEVAMLKGAETLASLAYTRDSDGQLKTTTSKGLPGEESLAYAYDANRRLEKAATISYEYDAADNPTKVSGTSQTFSAADELEKAGTTAFSYGEDGERTKATPEKGPATTYGWDQAQNLIKVERPKEGETPEIKDSFASNGEGLRMSQTINGTTAYWTWDTAEEGQLPLVVFDGVSSYVYGPGDLPIEQISSGGTVTYLHHDQQGSSRLLTGATGTVTGKCSYGPYGAPTCEGATTTPLGYDAEYTSSDTGFVYMRARSYDPSTGQFLSVDPLNAITRAPYNYADDNPLNAADPTGRGVAEGVVAGCEDDPAACVVLGAVAGTAGVIAGKRVSEEVISAITTGEATHGADEGEEWLNKRQEVACSQPNPGSLEKLRDSEIERILNEDGSDIHTDKEQTVGQAGGRYDYYRDKSTGEIWLVPKAGGEAIPTGLG